MFRPLPSRSPATIAKKPILARGGAKHSKAEFNGPCCVVDGVRGTRKVGDGKPYTCKVTGQKYYACAACRLPLALTDEQRARIARNAEDAFDKLMLKAVMEAEKKFLAPKDYSCNCA